MPHSQSWFLAEGKIPVVSTDNFCGSSKYKRSLKTENEHFCRLLLVAEGWKCDSPTNSNFLTWTLFEKAIPEHCHHATLQDSTDESKKGISQGTLVVFQHLKKKKSQFLQYFLWNAKAQAAQPHLPSRKQTLFFSLNTPTSSVHWLISFCLTWQDQAGQIWIIRVLLTGSAADPLVCLSFSLINYINEGCKS